MVRERVGLEESFTHSMVAVIGREAAVGLKLLVWLGAVWWKRLMSHLKHGSNLTPSAVV